MHKLITFRLYIILSISCVLLRMEGLAQFPTHPSDTSHRSTIQQAKAYLAQLQRLDSSTVWPGINPVYYLENLHLYLDQPLYALENKNTNFCGYTALSFITLERDPVGFIQFMLQLYREGKATMGDVVFTPSKNIRLIAGKLKYKGMLDINPATQVWLLTLADHFKGYLNIFNRRYNKGDENTIWASTNFAKFNRMLRKLFNWKVYARGADLIKPSIPDLYNYIEDKMKTGTVFLYLNNRLLYKKKHVVARIGIPTHYVLVKDLSRSGDIINLVYMDGGRTTHQQVSNDFLKKIVYGVTYCTNK